MSANQSTQYPYTPNLNYTPAPNMSTPYGPVQYNPGGTSYTYFNGSQAPGATSTSNLDSYLDNTLGDQDEQDSGGGLDVSDFLSSSGFGNKTELKKQTGFSSVGEYLQYLKGEEAKKAELAKKQAQEIGGAFDPIIAELDKQIGFLPGQQADITAQLQAMAASQAQGVDVEGEAAKAELETEKTSSLRNLEEDIRNSMQAAGTYIGSLGAGSSSAVGQASEAVLRAGQRSRSDLLSKAQATLGKINATILKEKTNIETWKNTKLYELVSEFQNKKNQLGLLLAQTKGEKAKAVQQLIFNLDQQYRDRLSQLDDTYGNYIMTLEQWGMERSAQLEDYAMKLGQRIAEGKADINESLAIFNNLIQNGYTPKKAQDYMTAQGYTLPTGLTGETEDEDVKYSTVEQDDQTYFYNPQNPQSGLLDLSGQPVEFETEGPSFWENLTSGFGNGE